jgi:hypothetical protein
MRIAVNLALFVIICLLLWVLYKSIEEPIAFKAEREKRERAVIDKLRQIRSAQEYYRDITGSFAGSFDSLTYVLKNDSFRIVKVIGDPDDPNYIGEISYDTTYRAAYDSVLNALALSTLDSLPYIPFSGGKTFDIQADTTIYQSTKVNVVEVGTPRNVFMGKYADPSYARYDQSYDPNSVIKFGDLNTPKLAGNWE